MNRHINYFKKMDNWQKPNYHQLPLRWFVLTVKLIAFKITLESNLWTWFWVSFYIVSRGGKSCPNSGQHHPMGRGPRLSEREKREVERQHSSLHAS